MTTDLYSQGALFAKEEQSKRGYHVQRIIHREFRDTFPSGAQAVFSARFPSQPVAVEQRMNEVFIVEDF